MSKTKQSCNKATKAEAKIPMCRTKFCFTTMQLLHAIVLLEGSVVKERFGSFLHCSNGSVKLDFEASTL